MVNAARRAQGVESGVICLFVYLFLFIDLFIYFKHVVHPVVYGMYLVTQLSIIFNTCTHSLRIDNYSINIIVYVFDLLRVHMLHSFVSLVFVYIIDIYVYNYIYMHLFAHI